MKTLLVALNAKYIHSNLAVWYLKAACGEACGEIRIKEFTINDQIDSILTSVYEEKAQTVAFSCYIWNIGMVLKLARNLKQINSDINIILGGPEVSFESDKLLEENPYIDFILSGEGEISFKNLLLYLQGKADGLDSIQGLTCSQEGLVRSDHNFVLIHDLSVVPSPYSEDMLAYLKGKIVYFEASRGCPFSCSYCLSSTFSGVRWFPMERVKNELRLLLKSEVKQVKFVDRTFNCSMQRAKDIFRFIIEEGSLTETNFHFEVAADLFDEEMLAILEKAPAGLIQFEIGVQSTHPETLEAISRKTSWTQVKENVSRLYNMGNLHLHLDLIAGLPFENYDTFQKSFNEIYELMPQQLQLGFLKMLKGSRIREEAGKYGYKFRAYPPYEVLENEFITFEELLELKGIEEVLERFFNSRRFVNTLDYAIKQHFNSPFHFYRELYIYNKKNGYLDRPLGSRELYETFAGFAETFAGGKKLDLIIDLIRFDFFSSNSSRSLPSILETDIPADLKEKSFEFLKNQANIQKYVPHRAGLPAKQVYKSVHFAFFDWDIKSREERKTLMLFDYSRKHKVSGLFQSQKIIEGW